MKKHLSLLLLLSISIPILITCTSYQRVSVTRYQKIKKESYPIEIVSIDAKDASYQDIGDEYISDILSNIAFNKGFVISDERADYKALLKIKETKFDKNLNSFYSVWLSLDIVDKKSKPVIRILLLNNSRKSIQSSAYLYSLLNKTLRALKRKWKKLF